MDTSREKLEQFTSVIVADAQSESRAIYEEIRQESQKAMTAAEDEALAEAFRYIKSEINRISNEKGRLLSKTLMENKRAMFLRREAMADEVMELVRARLAAYVRTEDYARQLETMLRRIVQEFGTDTVVYLREEDAPLAARLAALELPFALSFRTGSFLLGGLEAESPQRKLHVDESFDTTLNELRSHFSELFGLQLDSTT